MLLLRRKFSQRITMKSIKSPVRARQDINFSSNRNMPAGKRAIFLPYDITCFVTYISVRQLRNYRVIMSSYCSSQISQVDDFAPRYIHARKLLFHVRIRVA